MCDPSATASPLPRWVGVTPSQPRPVGGLFGPVCPHPRSVPRHGGGVPRPFLTDCLTCAPPPTPNEPSERPPSRPSSSTDHHVSVDWLGVTGQGLGCQSFLSAVGAHGTGSCAHPRVGVCFHRGTGREGWSVHRGGPAAPLSLPQPTHDGCLGGQGGLLMGPVDARRRRRCLLQWRASPFSGLLVDAPSPAT